MPSHGTGFLKFRTDGYNLLDDQSVCNGCAYGTYTGSMLEVRGTSEYFSEHQQWGIMRQRAVMAVALHNSKIQCDRHSKTDIVAEPPDPTNLSATSAPSCSNMDITIICSFFIGFLKAFIMLEFIIQVLEEFLRQIKVRLSPSRQAESQGDSAALRWRYENTCGIGATHYLPSSGIRLSPE